MAFQDGVPVQLGTILSGLLLLTAARVLEPVQLFWLGAAVALIIVAVIAIGTWGLLRDSVNLSLQAAPPGMDPGLIAAFIDGQAGVAATHDLHIWPLSTTETALTVHLVMPGGYPGDDFATRLAETLKEQFGVDHTTVQIETDPNHDCLLKPDTVV